jgi:hypothetical protein
MQGDPPGPSRPGSDVEWFELQSISAEAAELHRKLDLMARIDSARRRYTVLE